MDELARATRRDRSVPRSEEETQNQAMGPEDLPIPTGSSRSFVSKGTGVGAMFGSSHTF